MNGIKLKNTSIRFMPEEQPSREKLLWEIVNLRKTINELQQEKTDLEILLETTTEHSDLIESELQKEISDRQKAEIALQKANQELQQLTMLDGLTKVANRRRFDNYLAQEWQRLTQEGYPLSLILCDVDYFKSYNDTYGHQAGDDCLQQIAQAIKNAVNRPEDLVARYGGEEFAVILPNTKAEGALHIAETIRLKIQSLQLIHIKSPINKYITLSLGVFSTIPAQENSPQSLIFLS